MYERNNRSGFKLIAIIIILLAIAGGFASCAMSNGGNFIDTFFKRFKGELVGNNYTVHSYDNYGGKTFTIHGNKIAMQGETDESGEISSYIDITIDGYNWHHVGGTLLFIQDGVDIITEFDLDEELGSDYQGSLGLIAVDRYLNHYKNLFGEDRVILISSQNGTPICILQGKNVNMTIPDELPKTTLLNIDGNLVYIHRGNIDVFSSALFK